MDDRTVITIFAVINMLLWWVVIDFMVRSKHHQIESEKRMKEYMQKCQEYWHDSFQNINKMVQMDTKAMGQFIEQLSGIMLSKAEAVNEEENRK